MGTLLTALHHLMNVDRDDRGATAVEYGMIVALIAGVIAATVAILGGDVSDAYDSVVGTF